VERVRTPLAVAATIAAAAILWPQIEKGAEAIYGAGGSVVGAFDSVVSIPGDLSADAQDCYTGTGTSTHTGGSRDVLSVNSGEGSSAQRVERMRQNCATYTGFLEGVLEYGFPGLVLAGGAIAVRRRFSGSSHDSGD
jgi:hypothetical protein